jgi:hypothetical protein
MNEEPAWMTGVWHVWTENFSGMDLNKKEVWTGIGPLNHAFTLGQNLEVWETYELIRR